MRPHRPDTGGRSVSSRTRNGSLRHSARQQRSEARRGLRPRPSRPRLPRTPLSTAASPEPDQRVLDVATGTGMVARALVRAGGCRVVGVDQSAEMLARAAEVGAADPSSAGRIAFQEAYAERLPFADAEFDHVTFTYLLRYVDDPGGTLRELARVLRPGGRLASVEFGG